MKTIEREQKSNSYLNSEQKNNQIGIKSSKLKIELFKKDLKEIEASSILLTYLTYYFWKGRRLYFKIIRKNVPLDVENLREKYKSTQYGLFDNRIDNRNFFRKKYNLKTIGKLQ